MRRSACQLLTSVAFLITLVVPVSAQLTTQTIVSGVTGLVGFVQDNRPLMSDTFYLVRQSGTILVFQNGSVLPTPFLDLSESVATSGEDQGLLAMAVHPDASRNWVFVSFTNSDGHVVVARFTRQAGDPLQADPASRLDLLWPTGERIIREPTANNNGGYLAFGPDGFLYIGLGDGGGVNDQFGNAQNPNSLLGKMLRIDVSVDASDPKGYRVPPSNPFVGLIPFGEIWDIGLRNPRRFSFDRRNGALIIADVGQSQREEVNYEPVLRGGRNYGWPVREGMIATPGVITPPAPLPLSNPVFDYPRNVGSNVTGGYVYQGNDLVRSYLFADRGTGLVASVRFSAIWNSEATFLDGIDHTSELGGPAVLGRISSFADDSQGGLYIIRHDAPGAVYKIVPRPIGGPPVGVTAQVNGSNVALSWTPPAGPPPLAYELQIGVAPNETYGTTVTIPGSQTVIGATGVANGQYFVKVRGLNGQQGSTPGPWSTEIAVVVGCGPPPPPANVGYSIAENRLTISWSAVAGVSGYLLEHSPVPPPGAWSSFRFGPETTSVSGPISPGPGPGFSRQFFRLRSETPCGGLSVPVSLSVQY